MNRQAVNILERPLGGRGSRYVIPLEVISMFVMHPLITVDFVNPSQIQYR